MRVWDDNEAPVGYLITFRTYGTWLHGDERGSVDRFRNGYREPRIPQRDAREEYNRRIMKREPVLLDSKRRRAVHDAIRETCDYRGWVLRAINIRTNHGHVVVSAAETDTGKILNAFKANSTRRMRETGCWTSDKSPWVDKGSQRVLWNEASLHYACEYVANGQGPDLDDFDGWLRKKNPPATAGGSPSTTATGGKI